MITHKTVLILGAGASIPYGFPSGQELMTRILGQLDPRKKPELRGTLIGFGCTDGEINDFHKCLSRADMPSVDLFLEHRPEFMSIGKLSIVLTLYFFEQEGKLFYPKMKGKSWYEYLWNKLNDAHFEEFDKNRLAIITFNYDRSFEHYLFTVMQGLYGKSDNEIAEKLSAIPIIHVHGRLGALPWQDGAIKRRYDAKINMDQIKDVSDQIKVLSEKVDRSTEFDEAFEIISSAKKICFLGFGYNRKNLQRLRINESLRGKTIVPRGSSYNLGMAQIEEIRADWSIEFFPGNNECLEFLKNHFPLN